MDKIEIIDIDDEDDSEEDEEIDEEEYEEQMDEEGYEEYKESIKKKTDRELLESVALRIISLERNMKQMQDDLVDTYNLLVEEQGIEDEED
ncbi:MAG: hypothetical protein ACP5NZ_00590 [Nanobdellota archaeon]